MTLSIGIFIVMGIMDFQMLASNLFIDKVNDKDVLLAREGQWVYRLRSLKPDRLNESDFFFGHNRGERGRK